MAKQGLTEIIAVIDKSGSMKKLSSSTIEGFNSFLNQQKELSGEANFSLVLFSGHGKEKILFDSVDIKLVTELDETSYNCDGLTALYDCVGKTIKAVKQRIKSLPDEQKPERVIFMILTDGEENDSKEFDRTKVFEMIKKREEKNWSFIFLGANQDSFQEGGKIGVKGGRTLDFAASADGINFAFQNMSDYTKVYRSAVSASVANSLDFNEVIKKDADKDKDSST